MSYYSKLQIVNKVIHEFKRKLTVAFSNKFYDKIWISFCLNSGKHFFADVSFESQQKKWKFL